MQLILSYIIFMLYYPLTVPKGSASPNHYKGTTFQKFAVVGTEVIGKAEKQYATLCELLNRAPRARLISMDAIRDDGFSGGNGDRHGYTGQPVDGRQVSSIWPGADDRPRRRGELSFAITRPASPRWIFLSFRRARRPSRGEIARALTARRPKPAISVLGGRLGRLPTTRIKPNLPVGR